uniref:DUF4283 domain-containing protein n=1 Tax=Quercus lobata TaxID=97700 RepID=A0A7N2L677_QUELO
MLTGGLVFLVGAIINAAAQNIAMLIIGRILLGIGVGFANQEDSVQLKQFIAWRGLDVRFLLLGFGKHKSDKNSPLWRSVKGFKVRRSSDHVLLFTFEKKEEVERIMSNAPWSFNKHLVVLQWYDKEVPFKDLEFDKISIWVQIHDVPLRFMNKTVAEKLSAVVGMVCQEIDEGEMDGGSFLRMKVTIDINKPLCRGRLISLSHDEQSWVSFKYERLPNICYWCGCLNHVDRAYDLWIESEGNLMKESQAYGAWIRAAPFVKGRNFVVKLNGDQPPTMAYAQTEAIARFQEAFNGISAESETEDTVAELVKSGGQDSGEKFEERLKEIDMELGRFDKVRGMILGDNLEGENVRIKEQMIARKADGSTPKSADRHAENLAGVKGFT